MDAFGVSPAVRRSPRRRSGEHPSGHPHRGCAKSDGSDAFVFKPHANDRTLAFAKPLTSRWVRAVVGRWAEYGTVGKVSPHDLRRTAITRALDKGLSYRHVQTMSGHKGPKTVQRYDRGRAILDLDAVNFIDYNDA